MASFIEIEYLLPSSKSTPEENRLTLQTQPKPQKGGKEKGRKGGRKGWREGGREEGRKEGMASFRIQI